EANVAAQVKHVRSRIRHLPSLGNPGADRESIVTAHQGIEDQLINTLRLRVGPDAGVEIRRAVLDDHHQRAGPGRPGAGKRAGKDKKERHPQRTRSNTEEFGSYRPRLLCTFVCFAVRHMRFFPAPPAASLPWRKEYCRAAVATSDTRARQRQRLPWPGWAS